MNDSTKQPSSYEAMTKKEADHAKNTKAHPKHDDTPKSSDELTKKDSAKTKKTHDHIQDHQKKTIDQLKETLKEKEKEIKDLKLRNLADITNLQERYNRESAKIKTYAHQYLAQDILEVADALEQAQNSLEGQQKEGIQLISDMLQKAFDKHQIEAIDPLGQPYDHNHHEAMVMQPSDTEKNNHIIQVIQKGYKIKDRLLRPARVIVAKNDQSAT